MILELDIGNTRIKWRVLSGTATLEAEGVVAEGGGNGLEDLLEATAGAYPLRRVRIACVRGGDFLARLCDRLRGYGQLSVEIARVQRHCQGVSVAYADPQRMGVDRWLAMLAAYRDAGGAVMIVDCGTALTIDLVDADGRHLGGYIVPGLRLGQTALTSHTAIRLAGEPGWGLEPGDSTESAIYHGTLIMLVALLEKTAGRELLRLAGEKPPLLYLAGGDAALLARYLELPGVQIRQRQGLVFDGLALALP